MTEVPEYLLERSRARRVALGLLSDDGGSGGDGGGEGGGGGGAVAAATGPSTADLIAAAKADAKLEVEAEPEADPIWVEAARSRQKIPMWAVPVAFFLPLWAFVYVKLTEPPPEPITALAEGANVYNNTGLCASCHIGDGSGTDGGGTGRPLWNGEVLLTFPELDDSMIEWIEIGTEGIGQGNPYGDPNRPGGAHVAGEIGANMPGFGAGASTELSDHQIYAVARYVREQLGGEVVTADEIAARDLEWEELGGGQDSGDGGGGGH